MSEKTEAQHCPCGPLGILFPEEAPHTTAEICKNALATALIGTHGMTVMGLLRSVDKELSSFASNSQVRHVRIAQAELKRAMALIVRQANG